MSFLSSGVLWGLGLVSVPIIIHLLHKRQFRVIDWAPMEYLKLSIQSSRRKVKLEQLLLLLIRCLFVASLILALARPAAQGSGALTWFAGGGRSTRVIVLDDSLSMDYRMGERSAFEVGQGIVARLVDAMGDGDALTLLVASEPERPVLKDAELNAGPIDEILAGLVRTDAAADWSRVLGEAARLMERAPHPVRELVLVTDLRRAGWSEDVRVEAERLAASGLTLKIVDVGSPEVQGVALTRFAPPAFAVVQDQATTFQATIVNGGSAPVGPLSASVAVGEVETPIEIPRLRAGETLVLPVRQTFTAGGVQTVRFTLQDEHLPADNARSCAVDVRPTLSILLVDGDPAADSVDSEIHFLASAFLARPKVFEPYALTDSEWLSELPEAFDLVVLANLSSVTSDHAARLEELVRAGMGLMIFPGDQVDAGSYEAHLHRGGTGLLPAALDVVRDAPITGMSVEAFEDSPLRLLTTIAPEALQMIRTHRSVKVGIAPAAAETTRVLARWDDGENSPAILERRVGRGRVLLWTTPADRAWGDWPTESTFLMGVCEASLAIADRGAGGLNHEAGAPIVLDTGGERVATPKLTGSDGASVGRLVARTEGGEEVVAFEGVTRAGPVTAAWVDASGKAIERALAVGPAASESSMVRVGREELLGWTASLAPQLVHHTEIEQLLQSDGKELWRSLALAALIMLALESVLMVWVGRRG